MDLDNFRLGAVRRGVLFFSDGTVGSSDDACDRHRPSAEAVALDMFLAGGERRVGLVLGFRFSECEPSRPLGLACKAAGVAIKLHGDRGRRVLGLDDENRLGVVTQNKIRRRPRNRCFTALGIAREIDRMWNMSDVVVTAKKDRVVERSCELADAAANHLH